MLKVKTKVDSKWGGIASKSGRNKNVGNYFWIMSWLNYQAFGTNENLSWIWFFSTKIQLCGIWESCLALSKNTVRETLNSNHTLGLEELFNSSGTVTFTDAYFIPRSSLESKLKPAVPFCAFCHHTLCWCIQTSEWVFWWFGESGTRLLHVFMFWFRIRMDLT